MNKYYKVAMSIFVFLFVLIGCADKNRELARQGFHEHCNYLLEDAFEVYMYSSDIPADEPALKTYEISSIFVSASDYSKALAQLENDLSFEERRPESSEQFRVFVNEKPGVTKVSCMFDMFNQSVVYMHRRW